MFNLYQVYCIVVQFHKKNQYCIQFLCLEDNWAYKSQL